MPITSSVEQIISSSCYDSFFQVLCWNSWNSAVIKLVPFLGQWVGAKCSIMSEAHVSEVIWNGVAIIDETFSCYTLNILAHIKTFEWEINFLVNFLSTTSREHSHVSHWLLALFESLKVNYQYWWYSENLKLLCCLYMFFTFVTIPLIILVQ